MSDSVSHEPSQPANDPGTRWEIEFYEDILKRNPDYVEVLAVLGSLYTGNRMYRKGLHVDQRLAQLKQDDPIVQYNLACSYSLLNQADKALEVLKKAIELGYGDVDHMTQDTDLDNLRSDPRYVEIVDRIRCRNS